MRRPLVLILVAAAGLALPAGQATGAGGDSAAEKAAREIQAARDEANQAAQAWEDAQAELSRLSDEQAALELEQADLQAYCVHVSDALRAPCLLYNLPDFTNGLEAETAISLLRSAEFIVGIKDSSGEVDHLSAFADARNGEPWTLLVGDDRLLDDGLRRGWDGSVSGIAGFCPELIVALYRSHVDGRDGETARLQTLLDELIAQVSVFPTPWGIRIALAARGIDTGPLPLPLTPARKQQIAAFTKRLPDWLLRNGLERPGNVRRATCDVQRA